MCLWFSKQTSLNDLETKYNFIIKDIKEEHQKVILNLKKDHAKDMKLAEHQTNTTCADIEVRIRSKLFKTNDVFYICSTFFNLINQAWKKTHLNDLNLRFLKLNYKKLKKASNNLKRNY